jgi:nitrogen fixation-related uncharacterized protein
MQAVSAKEVLVEVPGQGEEALVEVPGEEEESPLSAEEGTFTRLKNPLEGTVDSIPGFVETLLRIALMIGVPIVALAIIYSGFLFVAAQGNPKKLEEARATFMYTLIGAALVLGAVVIAKAIGGTIDHFAHNI